MEMPKFKLTKTAVESQTPQAKDIILHDTEVKGFQAKITPAGRRSYQVYYRTKDGRERRPKIGDHGIFTVQQARDQAKVMLGAVQKGEDPAAALQALKSAPSMEELCARYMCDYAEIHKAEKSISEDAAMIRNYILPAMGDDRVSSVSTLDIDRLHSGLKHMPHRANRLVALLSKMFGLAEQWGLRDYGTNPTRYLNKFKEENRHRYLSDDEIILLFDELDKSDSRYQMLETKRNSNKNKEKKNQDLVTMSDLEGVELPQITAFFRLLMYTGCRLNEIRTLQWKFVDLEKGLLRLPKTKTGPSTRILGQEALECLEGLSGIKYIRESDWVIPSKSDPEEAFVNVQKAWRRIRARCGIQDVRIHDIRHTVGATATGLGLSLPMIGKLLGHSQASTTQRYAHAADEALKEAASLVSGHMVSKSNKD